MIEKVRRSGRKAMDVRKNGLQFSLNRINWMLRATPYGRRSETRKGNEKRTCRCHASAGSYASYVFGDGFRQWRLKVSWVTEPAQMR